MTCYVRVTQKCENNMKTYDPNKWNTYETKVTRTMKQICFWDPDLGPELQNITTIHKYWKTHVKVTWKCQGTLFVHVFAVISRLFSPQTWKYIVWEWHEMNVKSMWFGSVHIIATFIQYHIHSRHILGFRTQICLPKELLFFFRSYDFHVMFIFGENRVFQPVHMGIFYKVRLTGRLACAVPGQYRRALQQFPVRKD